MARGVRVSALLDVMLGERKCCATLADRRAKLWGVDEREMSSGNWPATRTSRRERGKEALVLADALGTDQPAPPYGRTSYPSRPQRMLDCL